MNVPIWVISIVVLSVCIYTMGYSITLWREKNRLASFGVLLLALAVIVFPIIAAKR